MFRVTSVVRAAQAATSTVTIKAPGLGAAESRLAAIRLYKDLHRLGRDYPDPEYGFNKRLRRAFEKHAGATDPEVIAKNLALGEHIKKEVLAMLSLKKYRHLKRMYPSQ